MTHASLATVSELFSYKAAGFELPEFPGYSTDQWGIKAHNRPWIEAMGRFGHGLRIAEVGGAYSRLPEYLGKKYNLEPWVIDDFGIGSDEPIWSRWGNPTELPAKYPTVRYSFNRMGHNSAEVPSGYFDRVFSVSTLEHIGAGDRLAVLKDIHRCLAPRGIELHTIDVSVPRLKVLLAQWIAGKAAVLRRIEPRLRHDIDDWFSFIRESGVRISVESPNLIQLLARSTLVESPDVVFRYYPPTNAAKPYRPAASLLVVIEDL